jgi:hypothetical protein
MVIQQSGGVERTVNIWDKPFYTLGRFGADVLIHGEGTSRLHAVVYHTEAGDTCLVDLGSRHGTHIHDFRLEPHWPHPWKEGVIVTFGPPGKRDRAWLVTSGALPIRGSPSVRRERALVSEKLSCAKDSGSVTDAKDMVKRLGEVPRPSINTTIGALSADLHVASAHVLGTTELHSARTYPYVGAIRDTGLHQLPQAATGAALSHLPQPPKPEEDDRVEPPAKRQRFSFGDLLASRENVAPPDPVDRPSKKASELWGSQT